MSSTGNLLSTDPGRELLVLLVSVAKAKLERAQLPPFIMQFDEEQEKDIRIPNPEYVNMPAGEMAAIIKLLSDNSVTLANIRRGDFGEVVQRAEEAYPFPDTGRVVQ